MWDFAGTPITSTCGDQLIRRMLEHDEGQGHHIHTLCGFNTGPYTTPVFSFRRRLYLCARIREHNRPRTLHRWVLIRPDCTADWKIAARSMPRARVGALCLTHACTRTPTTRLHHRPHPQPPKRHGVRIPVAVHNLLGAACVPSNCPGRSS